ncbi:hypothetical protein OC844_001235 [Tilletia horrida]|nr:hypothetical protein OC844_001235 [Tilletia horrida]
MDLLKNLPKELALPILLQLDIASLARLRGICREWRDFFSQDGFWRLVAVEHGLCARNSTDELAAVLSSRSPQDWSVTGHFSNVRSFYELCRQWYTARSAWDGRVQSLPTMTGARTLPTAFRGLDKMRLKVAQLFVIYHHDETHRHKVYLMDIHTRDVRWTFCRPKIEGRVPVAVMPVRPDLDASGNVLGEDVEDSFHAFGLSQNANQKATFSSVHAEAGHIVITWSSPASVKDSFQIWKTASSNGPRGSADVQLHTHQVLNNKLAHRSAFHFPTFCTMVKSAEGSKVLFYEILPDTTRLASTLKVDHLRNKDEGVYGLDFDDHTLYTYSFHTNAVNAYDRTTNELKWCLGDYVQGDLQADFHSLTMARPRAQGQRPRKFYEAELKKDTFPLEWEQFLNNDEDFEWPFHQVSSMVADVSTDSLILMLKAYIVIVPRCKDRGRVPKDLLPPITTIRLFERGHEQEAYLAQWPLAVSDGRILTFGMDDAFLIDLNPDRSKKPPRASGVSRNELPTLRLFMAKVPRPNKPYDHDSEELPPSAAYLDVTSMFAAMDRVWDLSRKTRSYAEDGLHTVGWNSKIHRVDRGIVHWTLGDDSA